MFEIKDLFALTKEGSFNNVEEFLNFANNVDNETLYSVIKEGSFSDVNEFSSMLKKKGQSDSASPKDIMESTTKEREQNFSLDLLERDEEEAKPLLQDKLTGKGYSIDETGIGDALKVTDNITGEVTDVDLQPFTDRGESEELSKINKLLNTATDSKRKLLSTNSKQDFDNNVDDYIERLRNKYSNFAIDQIDEENVRISKGDQSQVFKVKDAYSGINNFIYQNLDEKEAATMISRLGLDTFKSLEEGIKNIESTVDVSVEAAETEVYNKDYFKGLFDFLESNGVAISEEAKNNLSRGTKLETITTRNGITSRETPLSKEEIQQNIQNYFGDNLDMINAYDISKIVSVRKQKIDRAKKLKTEIYYNSLPNKEEVKEVLRQSIENITEEELDITANVKLAENDITKMYSGLSNDIKNIRENNPNAKFTPLYDDNGILVDITSDKPIKELDDLNKRVRELFKNYSDLYKVSKYKLEKLAAKKGTTDEFMDSANRNYDLIDNAMADLKNASVQLVGGLGIVGSLGFGAANPATMGAASMAFRSGIRSDMKESRGTIEKYYETRRKYDEALEEGSFGRFGVLTFAQQAPNIALALGSSGAGISLGLGKIGTQLLVGTQFGVTSAGQKYDELTTRQEFGDIAKKGLKELEQLKGVIPDSEYLVQKYELERALKDSEISSANKTLAVIGTGLVEGTITSFLGTAPNSIKILKDLKNVKSVDFIKDVLKSNYKAAGSALKEIGKRTGREVLEEGSIDALTQVNDYLFLGDQIDLSTLDDTAVTSIITSGAMNTPSIAYSTILKQVNVNRFKNSIKGYTNKIQSLKNMLNDTNIPDLARESIHRSINSAISSIADETTAMEGDALLMGAESIKEMLTLNGVKENMLKKAEVEADDSYDIARTKIDNYLSTLSEGDAKNFIDQMKYIDDTRNNLLGNIKYEGAVAKVFGDKGQEIASKLDPTLTPKQKYVEVYKQIRQEINENALKEFNALQDEKKPFVTETKQLVFKKPDEAAISPEQRDIFGNTHTDKRLPGKAAIKEITDADEQGVATATYVNQDTGIVDAIISSTDENNFVGYVRVYEDGKATNMFSAKMESTGTAFKNMITSAEATLPDNSEVIETSSISIGGLRSFNKSNMDTKVDSDGNVVTRKTAYSNATKESVAEKGQEAYNKYSTTELSEAEAELAKIEAAYPGITAKINKKKSPPSPPPRPGEKKVPRKPNTYSIDIDLPVMVKSKTQESDITLKEFNALQDKKEAKPKADDTQKEQIEKFRQQEIEEVELAIARSNETGETPVVRGQAVNTSTIDNINKKYDNQLQVDTETAQYLIDLKSTKDSDPTTYWSVSDVEVEVAEASTIIDTEDGSSVVKPDGDIAGLFKKPTSTTKGVAQDLLKKSVEAGGVKLDNFDGYLTKQYEKAGFRVVARTPFNKEYAPDGWNQEKHGTPDVVAMIYDPESKLNIEEKMFDDIENGYDQMIDYRDSLLSKPEVTEKTTEKEVQKDIVDNNLESFANRIIEGGVDSFSDQALQFYAENKDAIDNLVKEKQKQVPKDDSNIRRLAVRIADGQQNFSDTDIDLFAANEQKVIEEADAIAKTRGIQITSDNYKNILKSTKRPRKKVTTDEYAALKDQIRLEARAARDAQKDLNLKRKDLSKIIKDLAGKGIITANQSIVLINRISSVNLNNQKSVDNLIKYMDKVYQNADYANNILRSNKNRKRAKKNIRTKIGSANVVFNTLNKLFSIDAKIIPQNVLDVYNELVSQFGESRAVLKLEDVSKINEKANSILEAIDNEISEIPKLQLLFESLDKVNVRGKEDFSATLAQALSDNKITKEDHDLIKKYKKDIVPSEKTSDTKETPTQFKFKENNVEDKMESKGADRLISLLKNKKAVDQLSDSLKRNIQAVIDNIDAGFFPSYANNISNEIESIIAKDNVIPRLKKGKYVFDRVTSKIKNLFSSKKSTTEYQIRQNPLSDVDNILGNMNRTDIYDNIFGKAAKSYASLDAQIDIVKEKIAEADALLFKQFNNNGNKVTESKYRIMAYMLEREFQSNKDSNKVFSASESIKAIIDAQKKGDITTYSKKDIQILESILKDFQGDVDLNSKFDKFSKREKKAMSIIDDVNKSLSDKALYTASVIRGSRPNMIDNYVHHSVVGSNEGSVESITNKYNQFKTFSTKAGTLVERTPGVKPINFDILNSTLKGAKETLVDYHMTDTARVIFKTLNKIKADIVADEKSTERQIETANALSSAFDTAMRQVFETNYVSNGINLLGKAKGLGYKALLASVPRAAAELSSNLAYSIISSPKTFFSGMKYRKYTINQRGRNVMMNLNSEQTGKLYSKKITGKTADIGLFADSEGSSPTGAINDVQNKANQVLSYLANLTVKPTEKIAEGLISTPDKAISRPLWFGSIDSKFKEITGKNIDMDAINNGDKKYLEENKEALNEATIFADKEVTRAATSVNVFNGILKNKIDPNDSTSLKVVKEINGFMSNFIIYEYTTARSALSALINSGKMSRKKGAALLLATTTRMSLYMVLYQSFSHLFDSAVSAITGADIGDEEFPEEDLLVRQLVGSISSMILGKNLGNFAKIIPNMSLETINEKYLEDLRKGEDYDPYKHSISFSMLSKEDLKKIGTRQQGIGDVLLKSLSGPYSPIVKTLSRAVELGAKATSEKSKDSTKQKAIEELTTRIIIEMMGNVGMIPFYKDVRRIVIKDFFKEEDTKKRRRPSSIIINRR